MGNNGNGNGASARTDCIVCGGHDVEGFLDLGETALANKFLTAEELAGAEPRFPLRVGFCHGCTHVQLTEHVPPVAMFEDYLYMSSASDTLKDHLYDLSDVVVERFGVSHGDLVIDIGCNDGTLLAGFQRHGVKTLGVDPARNLAERLSGQGIERYVGFFGRDTAPEIVERWGRAAVITATNTFPHIPDLAGFVTGIERALAPGGVFVIEAHYLVDILDQVAFDTIYHEHVSYWALKPMIALFERAGLEVVNAERLPLHHGQLRVSVQRKGEGRVQPGVEHILEDERRRGVDRIETHHAFAEQAARIKRELNAKLAEIRAGGDQVVGYGAPAKGNTLISYLELGPDTLDYIADRSPLKQGRYTPGQHIPVRPPEALLDDQPEYVLLLAWNFVDEVLSQQDEYRRRGGRFIIPVPTVELVE
jgi:SAM-dependent methyltransferase